MDRRGFLKGTTAAVGLLASQSVARPPAAAGSSRSGEMLYRPLGRTGEQVSVIGLGGFHIGSQQDEKESERIIRSAVDGGITFMDNCWDYHKGGSESRMGKALRDGYRQKVFLMTKIDGRTKQSAAKQIDESLKRLRTDHVDLLQFHEVIRLEDPDRIFERNGAMAAALEAKKAGKLRYIGFTGHKDPQVHLRMLEAAAAHDVRFDAVQMPLNVMDAHFRSFGHMVLPVLVRDGIGVLGMKPMANGEILASGAVTPIECLHYAMNLPTSVVITGIDSMEVLEQAFEAVRTFRPLSNEQVYTLLSRTAGLASTGSYERYKTSNTFDGTARNPEWLG